jgi:hypothetical protein
MLAISQNLLWFEDVAIKRTDNLRNNILGLVKLQNSVLVATKNISAIEIFSFDLKRELVLEARFLLPESCSAFNIGLSSLWFGLMGGSIVSYSNEEKKFELYRSMSTTSTILGVCATATTLSVFDANNAVKTINLLDMKQIDSFSGLSGVTHL